MVKTIGVLQSVVVEFLDEYLTNPLSFLDWVVRGNKSESKVIFLFEGIFGTSKGQYSVVQMITEAQNTNKIHHCSQIGRAYS